jgi:hypothetical protein
LRAREVMDKLGSKQVLSGILEDDTLRAPYACHKTDLPLERGSILEISSAYVHEFEDRSLLLCLRNIRMQRYCLRRIIRNTSGFRR